jgi:hypothetical protein
MVTDPFSLGADVSSALSAKGEHQSIQINRLESEVVIQRSNLRACGAARTGRPRFPAVTNAFDVVILNFHNPK